MEIKTNEKLNETVKNTLRIRGDNMSLYALKRIEELEQLALCNVSCSLPSKKELFSFFEKIVEEKHKGLDELQKEYIKLGFMYYHQYLYDRNKK